MGQNTQKIVADGFFSAIDIVTDKKIADAGFDKTISAEIIEVIDASIGKYKVKYQDVNFVACSENTNVTYKKGTMVNILLPKGDMSSENKQILGASVRLGAVYVNEPDADIVYVKNGAGCLQKMPNNEFLFFKISELQAQESQVLYLNEKDENGNPIKYNIMPINEEEVRQYLRNSSSMLFSCQLKTDIDNKIRRKGKYGIRITLRMESDTIKPKDQETFKVFEFDTDDVIGSPYNLPVWANQEKVFDLDKGNFENIYKIEIFAKGFDISQGDGYIYFQDINLFGANALDKDAVASGQVVIATPKGKFFNDGVKEIDLEAKVYFGGKLAKKSEQNYDIYWFRKNPLIFETDEKFNKVGRVGWACLNTKTADQWLSAESIHKLKAEDCLAKETVFKCVIVSAGMQYDSAELTVYNSNANYECSIDASQSVYFTNDIGSVELTAKLIDAKDAAKKEIVEGIKYQWTKTDLSKNTQVLTTNKKLTVDAKDVNIQTTITCGVYETKNGSLLATADIVLHNEARAPEYTLLVVNGKQTFKYDTNGYSPVHPANEHQTPILPLSFEIYDRKGQRVKDEIVAEKCKGKIRWLIPKTDNTLLDLKKYKNSDVTGAYYVESNMTLDFTVKDRYLYSANQNQIQLEVEYIKDDGKPYHLSSVTEFVFVKEGMQGTNGTDAVCWVSHPAANSLFLEVPYSFYNSYTYGIQGDKDKNILTMNTFVNNELTIKEQDEKKEGNESLPENLKPTDPSKSEFKILSRTILVENSDGEEEDVANNEMCYTIKDDKTLSVNRRVYAESEDSKVPYFELSDFSTTYFTNIIQGKATVDNKECTNVLPIVTTFYPIQKDIINNVQLKTDYYFKLKPNSGFLNVQYETNGKYPKYNQENPFEIEVYEVTEHIENKPEIQKTKLLDPKIEEDSKKLAQFEFTWSCSTLFDSLQQDTLAKYKCRAKVKNTYDSYSYAQAIWVTITKGGSKLAIVHIPVYFYLNKYSNAAINAWDGNGIEINEDKGIILSPQVGAGRKEKDNSFTGVVIGTKEIHTSEEGTSPNETGLFGYNHGHQTIFLDAQTGKSKFGIEGKGQIIIDPGDITDENNTPQATITGGNYTGPSAVERGEPDEAENQQGSGLCINLTRPSIDFGSGNFNVSPEGHITAKGGGTIAGWKINDDAIFSKKQVKEEKDSTSHKDAAVGMSSASIARDADKDTDKGSRLGNFKNFNALDDDKKPTKSKPLAFWAGGDSFMVAHDGTLKTTRAAIGGGELGDDIIYIGASTFKKNNEDVTVSSIYSGKTSFSSANSKKTKGFYLGADGFAIGRRIVGGAAQTDAHAFSVDADGHVMMTSGQIGYDPSENGTAFWTVEGNAIRHGAKAGYNTLDAGVYIGTDGIGLGRLDEAKKEYKSAFYVSADGKMVGSDINIIGGEIRLGNSLDDPTFLVTNDGAVTANNITATYGSIGGWNIESEYLQGGNTKLHKSGALSHTGGKWSIDSTGNATFNWIVANGGTIAGINISTDKDGVPTGLSAGNGFGSGKTGFAISSGGSIQASGANIYGVVNFDDQKGHYFKMGVGTQHPEVSGLNMTGEGGINVNGKKGISNCPNIGNANGPLNISCGGGLTIASTGGYIYLKAYKDNGNNIRIPSSAGEKGLYDYIRWVVENSFVVTPKY